VSPDGKFYWDGERWVSMPSQPAQASQPQVATQASHRVRNGCLGLAILAVLLAIGIGSGSHNNPSAPGSNSPSNSLPATPAAPAAKKVLLDKKGSGINTTKKFTAAGEWEIDWSYNCASFGSKGNFQIYVTSSDGSNDDVAANELGAKGSDISYEHQGGTYYLEMNSECNWHVIVKG
jgi:hypothetical protein